MVYRGPAVGGCGIDGRGLVAFDGAEKFADLSRSERTYWLSGLFSIERLRFAAGAIAQTPFGKEQ